MTTMKKSSPSPKEFLKKRLAKFIKLPHSVCNRKADVKEYVEPVLRSLKKKCKPFESELQNEQRFVRYNLPKHKRIFYTQHIKRKVAPDPFIMSDPHGICDLDEQFFAIIEGRPLRQFTDLNVYMANLRDITLFRANTAYIKDQIIQMDTAFQYELNEYEKINDLFTKSKNNFVHYAEESYTIAKDIQSRASQKELDLDKMNDTLDGYSFEYVKLRNQVSNIIAKYETLLRYKKFLNSMSPNWWQKRYNDSYVLGNKICMQIAEDLTMPTTTCAHDSKQNAILLQQLLPALYFTSPTELVFIFENYRSHCINYLQREASCKRTIQSVIKHRDSLKKSIFWECDAIQAYIDRCKEVVAYKEQCALDYQAVFDQLMVHDFERLYASYDSIMLFTCVQYVHTQLYDSAEDPKDELSTLMLDIERDYIKMNRCLDDLDLETVKAATNKMFAEDLMKMNRAHKAKRLLKECDLLSKGLYTSFEPSRKPTNK